MRTRIYTVILAALLSPHMMAQTTYSAVIKLEDGAALPGTPLLTVGRNKDLLEQCRIVNVFGDGTVTYIVDPRRVSRSEEVAWTQDSCPVTIRLTGYGQVRTVLRSGSTVVLKRTGDPQGVTVSVTTLDAPDSARKSYEKGVAALSKGNPGAAVRDLKRAVEVYPKYAVAWSALAEAHEKLQAPEAARQAAERATVADPSYVRPYVQLARLAIDGNRFDEAAATTARALEMEAGRIAALYFYDAVANYNLKQYDRAQQSALRAVELDEGGEIPMAEQVLGSTLAAKGDVDGALLHLYNYLQRSPLASDAEDVKKTIAALEKR